LLLLPTSRARHSVNEQIGQTVAVAVGVALAPDAKPG
jgi:hypothetical protein